MYPENGISSNAFQNTANISQKTGGLPLSIPLLSPNN